MNKLYLKENEKTIEIHITDEMIDDIMVSALEGGINYWCDEAKVVGKYLGEYASDQISRDGVLKLHNTDMDEYYILTKPNFLEGVKIAYKEHPEWFKREEDKSTNKEVYELNERKQDAIMADCLVQYGLWKEIVLS